MVENGSWKPSRCDYDGYCYAEMSGIDATLAILESMARGKDLILTSHLTMKIYPVLMRVL